LNVLLYNLMGIIGPAVATLAVTIGTGIMMIYFDAKVFKARIPALFDLKYLIIFITEGVFLLFALRILGDYLSSIDLHYFFILVIVAGIYGISMLILNGKRLLDNMKTMNRLSRHYEDSI